MVVGQGARVVLIGVTIGIAARLRATRLLGTLLFGIEAVDPVLFAAMALVMVGIGMVASYLVADIESVKALARRLLRVYPLRSSDMLQLAAVVVLADGRPQGKMLLTLDERLALAARREGFDVL